MSRLRLIAALLLAALLAGLLLLLPSKQEPRPLLRSAEALAAYRQDGSLARARAAGVGLEPRSRAQQLAHRHVALRLVLDGLEAAPPATLGTPDGPGGALAIHAHDASGVVHLHQRRGDARYRLSDLWAVYGLSPALLQRRGMTVALWRNSRRLALSADPLLSDHDDLVLEARSDGTLSARRLLERFDWAGAPVSAG